MSSPAAPPRAGWRWATRANALTALRLAMAPALIVAVVRDAHGLALALFWTAVVTDLIDGRVARRYGESSALGGFFDHVTDATFVASGLAAVAFQGEVPAVLPLLVMAAFAQYALDSRVSANRKLRASRLGRWNGIAYFVLLGVPVVRDGLAIGWPPPGLVLALGWVLSVSTVLSMLDRLLSPRLAPPR